MSDNNFEDNVLGYLAKLTQEMTGIKQDVSGVKKDISELKEDMSGVKQSIARIEVDHGEKLSALFDGQKAHSEQLNRLEVKVDGLTKIVSSHDVALEVMKRVK